MSEISKEEFCARFKAQMIKSAPIYDGSEAELSAYADEIAPTYYDEPWQREDGPEACADADISYWEEG